VHQCVAHRLLNEPVGDQTGAAVDLPHIPDELVADPRLREQGRAVVGDRGAQIAVGGRPHQAEHQPAQTSGDRAHLDLGIGEEIPVDVAGHLLAGVGQSQRDRRQRLERVVVQLGGDSLTRALLGLDARSCDRVRDIHIDALIQLRHFSHLPIVRPFNSREH
jgi:hypothetical protein